MGGSLTPCRDVAERYGGEESDGSLSGAAGESSIDSAAETRRNPFDPDGDADLAE